MKLNRLLLPLGLLVISSCGGGGGGDDGPSQLDLIEVFNGSGRLLPHTVLRLGPGGVPTGDIVAIREMDQLIANVTVSNPVRPVANWPVNTTLPDNSPGNHFIAARFNADLDPESILDALAASQVKSNLRGTITVTTVDPASGQVSDIRGRAFIGGRTYGAPDPADPTILQFERWIVLDGQGRPRAAFIDGEQPGLGFPGTENDDPFDSAALLVRDDTFVFIPDQDGDLQTYERFDQQSLAEVQIRLRVLGGVRGKKGLTLRRVASASGTVGPDGLAPEVIVSPSTSVPSVTPTPGASDVDPRTMVTFEFSEPVQPFSVGPQPTGQAPSLSGAVTVQFGDVDPASTTPRVNVPFTALPISALDLTTYILDPSFDFPGSGPTDFECGAFNRVDLAVSSTQLRDVADPVNQNVMSTTSFFTTGEGTGIVNAPVAPDTIYVGRRGAEASISVVDMNGFGAGTGNPTYDPLNPIVEGNSNYPNNPNARIQGATLSPPIPAVGTCTLDGGSAGVFTLTRDSSLRTELVREPLISSVDDMALGRALDVVFNNEPPPFGCQAGGGALCTSTGIKNINPIQTAPNTIGPAATGGGVNFTNSFPGGENLISWAPHPNPPPIAFPPICASPQILGQEPTSVDNSIGGVDATGAPIPVQPNLLVPSNNFLGAPNLSIPLPPAGIAAREQNAYFQGPSSSAITTLSACNGYQIRQQVGHFLYIADRQRREVVVLNSNRFTVLDRIPLPDPTTFAMSPNLDFLAVTNQSAGTVSFVDVNPSSSTFHTVVQTTLVGPGPRGIAWQPDNEDILVCSEADNSVSIISAFNFQIRKVVRNQLSRPFDIAVLPRHTTIGTNRNVYFAFILNRNGQVSLFESGPNGLNGWGFDEIIGTLPFRFDNPKAIQPEYINLVGGFWVAHENPLTPNGLPSGIAGGALSNVLIESLTNNQIPLDTTAPETRDMSFRVRASIGPDRLTGVPVDLAFDTLLNLGGLPNVGTGFAAGTPIQLNGKGMHKGGATFVGGTGGLNTNQPTYVFAAVPNSSQGGGVIDVIEITSGYTRFDTNPFQPGVQSIPAPGVTSLMDYYRQ